MEVATTARGHARQWRDHAGQPQPPQGELVNDVASLSYTGCDCGDGLARDSPNRAGHVRVVECGGAPRQRGLVSGGVELVATKPRHA